MRWLDELLRTPAQEYPKFLAAVSYLGALGPDAAAAALDARADQLDTLIDEAQSTLDAVIESEEAPRLFVIEVEYQLHMWRVELEWVREISREIGAGTLGWPTARMRGGRQVWVDPARAKPRGRKAKDGER